MDLKKLQIKEVKLIANKLLREAESQSSASKGKTAFDLGYCIYDLSGIGLEANSYRTSFVTAYFQKKIDARGKSFRITIKDKSWYELYISMYLWFSENGSLEEKNDISVSDFLNQDFKEEDKQPTNEQKRMLKELGYD